MAVREPLLLSRSGFAPESVRAGVLGGSWLHLEPGGIVLSSWDQHCTVLQWQLSCARCHSTLGAGALREGTCGSIPRAGGTGKTAAGSVGYGTSRSRGMSWCMEGWGVVLPPPVSGYLCQLCPETKPWRHKPCTSPFPHVVSGAVQTAPALWNSSDQGISTGLDQRQPPLDWRHPQKRPPLVFTWVLMQENTQAIHPSPVSGRQEGFEASALTGASGICFWSPAALQLPGSF